MLQSVRLPKTLAKEFSKGLSYIQIYKWYWLELSVHLNHEGKYLYVAWPLDSIQYNYFMVAREI